MKERDQKNQIDVRRCAIMLHNADVFPLVAQQLLPNHINALRKLQECAKSTITQIVGFGEDGRIGDEKAFLGMAGLIAHGNDALRAVTHLTDTASFEGKDIPTCIQIKRN